MVDKSEALARGAAQGATLGWGDEAVAKLLELLPDPTAGENREYAAGSRASDYLQTERNANASAAAEHPLAYRGAEFASGLPAALAVPAARGGSAAARIAANGLQGGALGALHGAGTADGADMASSAARGAALGGAFGTAGAAAREAAPAVQAALKQLKGGPPNAPPVAAAPSLATAGVSRRPVGILPPKSADEADTGRMPVIPRAPSPGFRPSQLPAADDLADAAMSANSAKAVMGRKLSEAEVRNLQDAQRAMDRSAKPRTAAQTAGTVRPGRRAPAAPAPTVPAPRAAATMPVPSPTAYPTMPAPGAGPTAPAPAMPTMRPTVPAPSGTPTIPAPAASGNSIEAALKQLQGNPQAPKTVPAPAPVAPKPTMRAPAASGNNIDAALRQLLGNPSMPPKPPMESMVPAALMDLPAEELAQFR